MTKFEKEFLINCLNSINNTISDKSEIERIACIYTQVQEPAPHYEEIQSKITESGSWSYDEKMQFSAAVFEAIGHNSFNSCTSKNHIKEIEAGTRLLLDRYLPLITANTDSDNRFNSIINNITKVKLQIENEPLEKDYPIENNPHTFFKVATVIGVGLAAIATLAFTS